MQTKEAYTQNLQTQLKAWDAKIVLLSKKVENATDDVKLIYAKELDEIKARYRVATKQIAELAKASGDSWLIVKKGADKTWDDLQSRVSQAVAKF